MRTIDPQDLSITFFQSSNPVSILRKSISGRHRPVRVADGPMTARCRFTLNASWEGFFQPHLALKYIIYHQTDHSKRKGVKCTDLDRFAHQHSYYLLLHSAEINDSVSGKLIRLHEYADCIRCPQNVLHLKLIFHNITKTRLFKYTENFTIKK